MSNRNENENEPMDRARRLFPRMAAQAAFWTIVATFVFSFYYLTAFKSLGPSIDGCTYATCARSILRGQGANVGWLNTISFNRIEPGKYIEPVQLFGSYQQSVWPLVLSVFFYFMGATDQAVVIACGFFFIFATPFIYFAGARIFSRRAANIAAALYCVNGALLSFTLLGVTESLFFFLLAGVVCFSVRQETWAAAAAFTLFFILAVLLKQNGILWVAPLALIPVLEKKKRLVRLGAALGVASIFFVFWSGYVSKTLQLPQAPESRVRASVPASVTAMIEQKRTTDKSDEKAAERERSWFFDKLFNGPLRTVMLLHSRRYPEHAYPRGLDNPDVAQQVRADWSLFVDRMWINVKMAAEALTHRMTSYALCVLFWIGCAAFFVMKKNRLITMLFLCTILIAAIPHLLTFAWVRYFQPGIIFFVLIGAGFVDNLAAKIKSVSAQRALCAGAVIACAFPVGIFAGIDSLVTAGDPYCFSASQGSEEYFAKLSAAVQDNTTKHQVIVSDLPSFTAWYGDRVSVWLPNDMRTLRDLWTRANLDYLLLTFQFRRPGFDLYWRDWLKRQSVDASLSEGLTFKGGIPTSLGAIYMFSFDVIYQDE